ncbi:MAG: winged helix-turn-helix transcriptional regulator [Promethearchaeota archaeon]
MLKMANMVRRKKAFENKWKVYETICKKPQVTIYELSKIMGWSLGKIDYYIKKLLKEGLINNSTEIVNGRVNKKYSPKKVGELINWKEMTHTKKL